jgi:hypothetical protein
MAHQRRPVFFTSIPKSGKNLIYSFYFALGLKRWTWGEAPARLHAAHFARASNRQNYAFPEVGSLSDAEENAALDDVMGQIAAFPANTIAHGHFLPADRLKHFVAQKGVSTIFVTRDPRDVLVSMLNFSRARKLPVHVTAMLDPLSDEEALLLLLEGRDKLVPFASYFDAYHDWLSAPGVTFFRFEDLIGERGGGDDVRQHQMCARLAELAGFASGESAVETARERMFNVRAGTFFKGQIGAWRQTFTPTVGRIYEREAGWLAARWGYSEEGAA